MFLCFVISTIVTIDIVTLSSGASIVRGTTLPFTLSDPASAMTTAMNLVSAGWARVRLRRRRLVGIWFRHTIAIVTRIRTYFTLQVTVVSVVGCVDVFAVIRQNLGQSLMGSEAFRWHLWQWTTNTCQHFTAVHAGLTWRPRLVVWRALIGRGVAMAFVYKQKHVEDGIPAFRVNRLSCCGRYTGLSGSKG